MNGRASARLCERVSEEAATGRQKNLRRSRQHLCHHLASIADNSLDFSTTAFSGSATPASDASLVPLEIEAGGTNAEATPTMVKKPKIFMIKQVDLVSKSQPGNENFHYYFFPIFCKFFLEKNWNGCRGGGDEW